VTVFAQEGFEFQHWSADTTRGFTESLKCRTYDAVIFQPHLQ